jgi:hypothetical protein
MDINDKPQTSKYAQLRLRRLTDLTTQALLIGLPELDLYRVFFANSRSKLVSTKVRLAIVERLRDRNQLNYLVILEANDDPWSITERIERDTVDKAFD